MVGLDERKVEEGTRCAGIIRGLRCENCEFAVEQGENSTKTDPKLLKRAIGRFPFAML
jgi:hypothetical protein